MAGRQRRIAASLRLAVACVLMLAAAGPAGAQLPGTGLPGPGADEPDARAGGPFEPGRGVLPGPPGAPENVRPAPSGQGADDPLAPVYAPRPPNENASLARSLALEAHEYALGIGTWAGEAADTAAALASAERAIGFARRALQLDNATAQAYSALGIAYRDTWRWGEAESAFGLGYEVAGNDPGLAHYYGLFSSYTGNHERAIAIAERSSALDPYSAAAHRDLGIAFAYAGNARAAAAALGQCTSLDRRNAICLLYLGLVETNLGRPGAADTLRAAESAFGASLSPSRTAALAHAWSMSGMGQEVARLFGQIERMDSERAVGTGTRALASLAVGEVGVAYTQLRDAVARAERGEPDAGFLALMLIKHNLLRDPNLDQTRFRELRQRIGSEQSNDND